MDKEDRIIDMLQQITTRLDEISAQFDSASQKSTDAAQTNDAVDGSYYKHIPTFMSDEKIAMNIQMLKEEFWKQEADIYRLKKLIGIK